jgi:predicted RNA-binding Zn-ribbon protein involved in translation (DUF1610 family)
LCWTWGVYDQNAIAVKEHWQLLSFSAEWIGTNRAITKALCDYKGYKPGCDDKALISELWFLLDEADIVVAHNGIDFDLKKINARFIVHGLRPPSPYKIIDTKRAVKQVAAFSSNKLDWLCQQLEIGKKIEHEGWAMWAGCMLGDAKKWQKMKKYNRHDITLLKQLYLKLAPWIRQPNMGMWSNEIVCVNPTCGSTAMERRGMSRSRTRVYQRYQCKQCGAWARSVYSEKGKHAKIVGI